MKVGEGDYLGGGIMVDDRVYASFPITGVW